MQHYYWDNNFIFELFCVPVINEQSTRPLFIMQIFLLFGTPSWILASLSWGRLTLLTPAEDSREWKWKGAIPLKWKMKGEQKGEDGKNTVVSGVNHNNENTTLNS